MDQHEVVNGHSLLIARNALGSVTACADCGNLQLTLQCLSVRLEPEAFRELAALVACAQQRIAHRAVLHAAPCDGVH